MYSGHFIQYMTDGTGEDLIRQEYIKEIKRGLSKDNPLFYKKMVDAIRKKSRLRRDEQNQEYPYQQKHNQY